MNTSSPPLVLVPGGSTAVARADTPTAASAAPETLSPRTLWKHATAPLRRAALAVFVFSIFINLAVLALPIYTLQVFDRVLNGRSVETLLALSTILLVFLAAQSLLDTLRATILRRAGVGFELELSDLVMRRSIKEATQGNPHAASGANDLKTVRSALAAPNASALFDLPWAPIFLLLIWWMHPSLGMLVAGALAVLTLLALASLYAARRPSGEENERLLASGEDAVDYMRNADVAQAMGMSGALGRRWHRISSEVLGLNMRVTSHVSTLLGITKFIRMGVQGGIMGLGAYLVLQGAITPGTMIAASILMARALAPVEQAVSGWKSWADACSSFGRLRRAVPAVPEMQKDVALPLPSGEISADGVSFAPRGTELLKNVTVNIGAGSALGIIGPSGAGKSTLARVLAGSLEPTSGTVRYDGAERDQWEADRFGTAIGYLPQDVQLLNGTVAENIARFSSEQRSEDVLAAARAADVHDLIVKLPNGYETRLGTGGVHLSGGQRQRLGLARALFRNPNLIVLDEPNANLDPEGERALHRAIEAATARNATVIVVSHSPNLLRVVQHIVVVRDGAISAVGPRDEIIQKVRGGASNVQSLPTQAPAFRHQMRETAQ